MPFITFSAPRIPLAFALFDIGEQLTQRKKAINKTRRLTASQAMSCVKHRLIEVFNGAQTIEATYEETILEPRWDS